MKNKEFSIDETTALADFAEEEEDDSQLDDEDTCSLQQLEKHFPLKYKITDESAVTMQKDYVLSLCKDSTCTRIAAGLSNASVQIFDISAERGLQHSNPDVIPAPNTTATNSPVNICGVHFLDESPNCLLVGTTNGLVRLFDLRATPLKEQARFEDTSLPETGSKAGDKNITCFDRNANSRIICAGTEQYQNNVYLLFYDVRERKQLGGYFESHQDDVTAVRFHGQNPDLLCSGSTDGLINVYNIKEETEDDALTSTINTESSVHKLNWHKNVYEKDVISCITHTNDFKTYECEEGDLVAEFERAHITTAIKRGNPANFNLIDAHNMEDGSVFLLAGTNYNKGEIMRSLRLQNKQLLPLANFEGNKQIVRESVYDAKTNVLMTCGESGIVSLWMPQTVEDTATIPKSSNNTRKMLKSKSKLKPY